MDVNVRPEGVSIATYSAAIDFDEDVNFSMPCKITEVMVNKGTDGTVQVIQHPDLEDPSGGPSAIFANLSLGPGTLEAVTNEEHSMREKPKAKLRLVGTGITAQAIITIEAVGLAGHGDY